MADTCCIWVIDSLGYFTCLTVNGLSTVDYAVVSESLLSSVLYFTNQDFTYLSDHAQIRVILKCKMKHFSRFSSTISSWSETNEFQWTKDSKRLIVDTLCDEIIINDIVNFEFKNYNDDQNGVDLATEDLNSFLNKLANKCCKNFKYKRRKKEANETEVV